MAVFFIFLVGVLNLVLGFGAAVLIKRRYQGLIAADSAEQAATAPGTPAHSAGGIDETAEEAIEAVEELLSQVGLDSSEGLESDPSGSPQE